MEQSIFFLSLSKYKLTRPPMQQQTQLQYAVFRIRIWLPKSVKQAYTGQAFFALTFLGNDFTI
jgi:hypothetical protein